MCSTDVGQGKNIKLINEMYLDENKSDKIWNQAGFNWCYLFRYSQQLFVIKTIMYVHFLKFLVRFNISLHKLKLTTVKYKMFYVN